MASCTRLLAAGQKLLFAKHLKLGDFAVGPDHLNARTITVGKHFVGFRF